MGECFGFVVDNILGGIYAYGLFLLTALGFFSECARDKFSIRDCLCFYQPDIN